MAWLGAGTAQREHALALGAGRRAPRAVRPRSSGTITRWPGAEPSHWARCSTPSAGPGQGAPGAWGARRRMNSAEAASRRGGGVARCSTSTKRAGNSAASVKTSGPFGGRSAGRASV